MQVATGKVVGGQVVVDGVPLVEGADVTVLTREPDEDLVLTSEQQEELLASIAEIERGDFVTAEELLADLRRFG